MDLSLERMRPTNWQHKARWFCEDCEQIIGNHETYASPLCDYIVQNGIMNDYTYDERLLGFFTSISLRTVFMQFLEKEIDQSVLPALKTWREFLLDKRKDVGQHSQHGFIVLGTDGPRVMCGSLAPDRSIVVTHFGPFIIVGRLKERKGMALAKIKIWDRSKIHRKGGILTPITEFRVGDKLNQNNITMDLMKYLVAERGEMFRRLKAFEEKNPEYWRRLNENAKKKP